MKKKGKAKKIRNSLLHLNYLKSARKEIFFIAVLFLAAIFGGILNADALSPLIKPILEDLLNRTSELSGLSLIIFIFINNAISSFLGMIMGVFLGIFPVITTITNGTILGYVLERTVQIGGLGEIWRLFPHGVFELPAVFISLGLGIRLGIDTIKNYFAQNRKNILGKILGILSLFLGLLGFLAINSVMNGAIFSFFVGLLLIFPFIFLFFISDKKIRKYNIQNIFLSLKVFVLIIIPLLIIAAVIEGILITFL